LRNKSKTKASINEQQQQVKLYGSSRLNPIHAEKLMVDAVDGIYNLEDG
jgi:hypothetical protein